MKFAVLAASILAAVFDHQLVDALAAMGFFQSGHGEYRHVAMLPALVAALTVLAGLVIISWLDARRDSSDWVVRLAHVVRAMPLGRMFFAVAILQFAALFAMESVEQLLSSGRLAEPFAWLGASLPLAAIIGTIVAACVTAALRVACEAVIRASRVVAGLCRDFVVALRARIAATAVVSRPASRRKVRETTCLLAFRSGLRAPPIA